MRKLLLLSLFIIPLSGCELLYDIGQDQALRDCGQQSDQRAYQDCMKRNRESYDDYEARRRKAQGG